jgi:hypothetical protein
MFSYKWDKAYMLAEAWLFCSKRTCFSQFWDLLRVREKDRIVEHRTG